MARAVTAINRFGGATLITASDRGHVELVRELLNAGMSVDHVNNLGLRGQVRDEDHMTPVVVASTRT